MAGGTGSSTDSDHEATKPFAIAQGEHTFEVGQLVIFSKLEKHKIAASAFRTKFGEGPFLVIAVQSVKDTQLLFDDKVAVGHHQTVTVKTCEGHQGLSGVYLLPYEEKPRSLGWLRNLMVFLITGVVGSLLMNLNHDFSPWKAVLCGILIGAFCVFAWNVDFSDPKRDPNSDAYM